MAHAPRSPLEQLPPAGDIVRHIALRQHEILQLRHLLRLVEAVAASQPTRAGSTRPQQEATGAR
jgi:hypothetical protein